MAYIVWVSVLSFTRTLRFPWHLSKPFGFSTQALCVLLHSLILSFHRIREVLHKGFPLNALRFPKTGVSTIPPHARFGHGDLWPWSINPSTIDLSYSWAVGRLHFRHFLCVPLCTPNETRTRISTLRGWPPKPISKIGAYLTHRALFVKTLHY